MYRAWRQTMREKLALVEPRAKFLPAGQARVHVSVEVRPVIMRHQVGKLVNDHIFNQFARRKGEFRIVGDDPLAKMTRAPKSLHLSELPDDARLPKPRRPCVLQFVQSRLKRHERVIRERNVNGLRTTQDVLASFLNPLQLGPEELLALPQRRPSLGHVQDDAPVGPDSDADSPDPLADHIHRDTLDQVFTRMQHGQSSIVQIVRKPQNLETD